MSRRTSALATAAARRRLLPSRPFLLPLPLLALTSPVGSATSAHSTLRRRLQSRRLQGTLYTGTAAHAVANPSRENTSSSTARSTPSRTRPFSPHFRPSPLSTDLLSELRPDKGEASVPCQLRPSQLASCLPRLISRSCSSPLSWSTLYPSSFSNPIFPTQKSGFFFRAFPRFRHFV